MEEKGGRYGERCGCGGHEPRGVDWERKEGDYGRREQLVKANRQFDAVLALEVIEHVADPSDFCESLSALVVPGGASVISTINRSMRAYATAIVAAEYLLNWIPKGTHQWSKFLTPEELVLILQRASISRTFSFFSLLEMAEYLGDVDLEVTLPSRTFLKFPKPQEEQSMQLAWSHRVIPSHYFSLTLKLTFTFLSQALDLSKNFSLRIPFFL
ncbi:hypothetical protein IEQ34_020249 [Dendrobium chrysotoxum]|uniref:3-demethylubiquinol 3-O-methyltransferase n=1 Tax=Dendrobium chrysotoxum TaxID=161865 RepID=A0AAV7G1J3_DENCH|nr:hypothetical protein IEQ34_020249 [Dendrobium chrysotoxum]